MKKKRRSKKTNILGKNIFLPIGTLVLVGLMFFLSTTYQANWTFNWEVIRPEIKDTVEMMEKYNSITSGIIGINTKTPQQYYRRNWLIKNATKTELERLISYPSGVIKVTAYEGLIRNKDVDKYNLLKQALNDTSTFFNYQSGCIAYPMMIGEYLIENVIPISDKIPPLPPHEIITYNLSKEEIIDLRKLYNELSSQKKEYLKKIKDFRRF